MESRETMLEFWTPQ